MLVSEPEHFDNFAEPPMFSMLPLHDAPWLKGPPESRERITIGTGGHAVGCH